MPKRLSEAEIRPMSVTTKSEFIAIISELNITEQQREIARLYYCEGKRMADIAYSSDLIYISEQSVARRLKDFAIKLNKYFEELAEENKF